jgi:hypothetical protein
VTTIQLRFFAMTLPRKGKKKKEWEEKKRRTPISV